MVLNRDKLLDTPTRDIPRVLNQITREINLLKRMNWKLNEERRNDLNKIYNKLNYRLYNEVRYINYD